MKIIFFKDFVVFLSFFNIMNLLSNGWNSVFKVSERWLILGYKVRYYVRKKI